MEIFWGGNWHAPDADDIPWTQDGDDLVYLFPQPVFEDGFPIDESQWSWDFRFTFATADLFTATATVLNADDGEAASSPVTVETDIAEQTADISLQLQGAVEGEVGVPVHYVGTLRAYPLPDSADLFFVEVGVSLVGVSLLPPDLMNWESF